MAHIPLELATSQELVDELTNRAGFVGIIIRSPLENRNGVIHHVDDFIIQTTMERDLTDQVLNEVFRQVVERENCQFGYFDEVPNGSSDEIVIS